MPPMSMYFRCRRGPYHHDYLARLILGFLWERQWREFAFFHGHERQQIHNKNGGGSGPLSLLLGMRGWEGKFINRKDLKGNKCLMGSTKSYPTEVQCHGWANQSAINAQLSRTFETKDGCRSLLLRIEVWSLSLKRAKLRCKKGLCWQTYHLYTNQSRDGKKRSSDDIFNRPHCSGCGFPCLKHISQGSRNATINVMESGVSLNHNNKQTNGSAEGEQAAHFAYSLWDTTGWENYSSDVNTIQRLKIMPKAWWKPRHTCSKM